MSRYGSVGYVRALGEEASPASLSAIHKILNLGPDMRVGAAVSNDTSTSPSKTTIGLNTQKVDIGTFFNFYVAENEDLYFSQLVRRAKEHQTTGTVINNPEDIVPDLGPLLDKFCLKPYAPIAAPTTQRMPQEHPSSAVKTPPSNPAAPTERTWVSNPSPAPEVKAPPKSFNCFSRMFINLVGSESDYAVVAMKEKLTQLLQRGNLLNENTPFRGIMLMTASPSTSEEDNHLVQSIEVAPYGGENIEALAKAAIDLSGIVSSIAGESAPVNFYYNYMPFTVRGTDTVAGVLQQCEKSAAPESPSQLNRNSPDKRSPN